MLSLICLRNIAHLIDNHYTIIGKQLDVANFSMNKDGNKISELNSCFSESINTKTIQGIMNEVSHITLTHR